ncbi:MAG: gliding motility-associated C-terminal domain-containing protein [Prevotellaceae bacterium]|jgi:gliding motility-associated-like protein|nr:gliding motility-associated C-terminal domain-containing protein [Prevotellaceae bacterium]
MAVLYKSLITTLLFIILQIYSFAQVSAIGADYSKPTSFLRGKPDMIHVFFSPATGNLEAKHHSNENSDFVWEKLDAVNQTFLPVHNENGVSASSLGNLSDGGYRVIIDSAGVSASIDTFAVWIIIDTFNLVGGIEYSSTCNWLDLEAAVRPGANVPYRIYQFENTSGTLYDSIIYNKLTTEWTTSADIYDGLPNIDDSWKKWNKTTVNEPPPLADAIYSVTIKDVFGKTVTASTPLIPAIAVYPAFTVEAKDENDNWSGTSTYGDVNNNALYRVRFKHDNSRHANKYTWKGYGNIYVEQTRNLLIWSQTTTDLSEHAYPVVPHHTGNLDGYPTGKYGFQLVVENTSTGCKDSTVLAYINVANSNLPSKSIPNAFTPNGDGQNDIFKFIKGQELKSMRTIKIQIFDRAGHNVYSYSGSYEQWQGWNGKLNNDGVECASGVYYYVVSGTGWDDRSYDGKEYRSFLHLFKD